MTFKPPEFLTQNFSDMVKYAGNGRTAISGFNNKNNKENRAHMNS